MQLPRRLARFNKVVTNRIQGLWAPYLPPWIVLTHRGRRSGREYHTPMFASAHGGRLVISVLYGVESDWVRNLTASGTASIRRLGKVHRIADAHLLPSSPELGWPARIGDHVVVARLD